jgi:hypothetical protein
MYAPSLLAFATVELATSRIIRENLIISQLAKKVPAFHEMRSVIAVCTRTRQLTLS